MTNKSNTFFMRKNYILFLGTLLLFKVSSAQSLSTSPTLIFTNNVGIATDNIANDGDGGSVNITDIDIQIYNISDVNGTKLNQLSWEDNTFLSSNSSSYSGLTRNDPSNIGSKGMAIKSVNGAKFKLSQFQYYNWGEIQSTINTVKGYRNNLEVATTTFQAFDGGAYAPMTITLGTGFQDVDEVRFYISAGGYVGNQSYTNHSINSIKLSSPVGSNLSVSDLELKSNLNIYPNPATDALTIELKSSTISSLDVYDVSGKYLFNQVLSDKVNTVNIEKLATGIYFFKVNSSEVSSINKIIKN